MIDDFRPTPRPAKPAPTFETQTPHAPEPTVPFQTPDQISQHEQPAPVELLIMPDKTASPRAKPARNRHWFSLSWPPTRRGIILIIAAVVVAAGGVTSALLHKKPATPVAATIKITSKPAVQEATTVPSTLTGLPVAPEVNQRPVIGAMIENSLDARPQTGLSQAGVVFEALAEGGVSRFLALYQDQQPATIGPIRSARPYYAQWLLGFQGAYAHVGGSPEALADIKSWNVQDLNQFYNAAVYHRVSSRPSPHNVYASVTDLANLATKKGYKSSFTGFVRKSVTPAKTASVSTINLSLSSSTYNVRYTYDAATNSYLRFEGGVAHIDAGTSKQLAPNVVVAMVVPLTAGSKDAQGSSYSNYQAVGNGSVYVFQNGGLTTGTWTKSANDSQITFIDSSGKTIALNPGQTWITAVSADAKVNYK